MLDTSAQNLYREIQAAERLRDSHTAWLSDLTGQYTGPRYNERAKGDHLENHAFEWIAMTTPQVAYDNPRVKVKSRRQTSKQAIEGVKQMMMMGALPPEIGQQLLHRLEFHDIVAKAMDLGLNEWIVANMLRGLFRILYLDVSFCWGATMVAQEPMPGYDPRMPQAPFWPQVYRLEQSNFFFDPLAVQFGGSRYVGHRWIRDKADLERLAKTRPEEGWDLNVIRRLSSNQGVDEYGDRVGGRVDRDDVDRKEAVCYDLWVPEHQINGYASADGFHGSIFTLAASAGGNEAPSAEFIRAPRPFFGHPNGPYDLWGVYPVPNNPYPLSPLVASSQQVDEVNAHARAISRGMSKYKRLILVSARNRKLIDDITNRPDLYVVPVAGFSRDQVEVVELGGFTAQQSEYVQILLSRVDRMTGINDTQRGRRRATPSQRRRATRGWL